MFEVERATGGMELGVRNVAHNVSSQASLLGGAGDLNCSAPSRGPDTAFVECSQFAVHKRFLRCVDRVL